MGNARTLLREISAAYHNWRGNFWFLPLLMGLASILLFMASIAIDRRVSLGATAIRHLPYWFAGGVDASQALLGSIAGAIGTITTVVFSISILTLQLASAEYTPRLLRSFTRSAVSQITLGIFLSTVAFSILTLSVVRSELPDQERFVPHIAINIVKLMAFTSLGMLAYFISHIAILISPSHIIHTVGKDAVNAYNNYVEEKIGEDAPPPSEPTSGIVQVIESSKSGYIQRIRTPMLLAVASYITEKHAGDTSRMGARVTVGDYVKKGDTLMELVVETPLDEHVRKMIHSAFVIGQFRLPEEDFRYGMGELESIALRRIKQLDPDTTVECVRALSETWLEMMKQTVYPPNRWINVKAHRVHLALLPVDTDMQFVQSFRSILEHSLTSEPLLGLASAIHEALSTITRVSVENDKTDTFNACWPLLIFTTCRMIEATEDAELLRRIFRAMEPLKKALVETDPERWQEMVSEIWSTASRVGRTEQIRDLWADTRDF